MSRKPLLYTGFSSTLAETGGRRVVNAVYKNAELEMWRCKEMRIKIQMVEGAFDACTMTSLLG